MSKNAGRSEMKESNALMRENVERLEALGVPTVEAQRIALQNPELVGLLEAEQLGPSAMEGVSTDPRLRQSQMKALEQLSGLSEQGLGAEDIAAFNQLRRTAAADAQAANAATLQNAAAQGTLDSGATLLSQLNAGQQQANRAQQGAEAQAANAAQARRDALAQYGNMSSNMANQDFSQKSQIANARDTINQFNAQNRQNVNAQNLANRQALEQQRAATANQQEMYNKGLLQQDFQNRLAKTTGVAGQTSNLAQNLAQQGQAAAQGQAAQTNAILGVGGQVGAAYAGKGK